MANKFLGMTGLGVIVDKIKEVIAQLATKIAYNDICVTMTVNENGVFDSETIDPDAIQGAAFVRIKGVKIVANTINRGTSDDSIYGFFASYKGQMAFFANDGIAFTSFILRPDCKIVGVTGFSTVDWGYTAESAYDKWLENMKDPRFVENMDTILMGSRLGEAVGYTHASWTKYWTSEIKGKVEQTFGADLRKSDALFYSYLAPYPTSGGAEVDEITADEVTAKFNS